jgi:predicted dehydrogenase
VSEPIRVGLAGFGLGGRAFHAPFIAANPRLALTHVLQRRGTDALTVYPHLTLVREFDELLDPAAAVQVVVIATPNPTHAPYACRALEAGKHVVVDKPFAVSTKEGRSILETATRVGRLAAPYQNRRWDGDFRTVRALLDRRWLGTIEAFHSRLDRWRPEIPAGRWKEEPAPGSGLLYDLGPHLIDQCIALFGMPDKVSADIGSERPGSRVDDRFDLALEYETFTAKLGAGLMVKEARARFRIAGSLGHYAKQGVDPQEAPLRRGERPGGPEWGIESPEQWGALVAHIDGLRVEGVVRTLPGNYGGFYDNLCDAIEGIAPLAVTPEDALKTLRVIELAIESARRTS